METEKMKEMETMEFMEQQPALTFCNGGRRVLVLMNERKETREVLAPLGEEGAEDGGSAADAAVAADAARSETQEVWVYDGVWLDAAAQTDAAVLAAAKRKVTEEIAEYDRSGAVNAFVLGGKAAWIDKDTRMGLRQNIADKVALGEKNITMWMGERAITLPCATAERIMCGLENYAYECYNVTAEHKKRVAEMETLEEVMGYDYTQGYPEKVVIEI